jgi:hypothetical protein
MLTPSGRRGIAGAVFEALASNHTPGFAEP